MKLTLIAVIGFFAPTLLLLLMFTIFGLPFQPDEGATVGLTLVGFFCALMLAVAFSD